MEITVRDIMTKDAVSVFPEDSLKRVVEMFFRYRFDGLPVVDKAGNFLGLITEYDLITKSSGLHLPTLTKVFENASVIKKDARPLRESFEQISKLQVRDIMNTEPIVVDPETSVVEASKIFVAHHRVNPIPVVKAGRLVGILSRYDLIRLFEFEHLGATISAVHNHNRRHGGAKGEAAAGELVKEIKQTVIVSKWRSRFWFIFALLFFIAGFIVAMAWVIRFTLN